MQQIIDDMECSGAFFFDEPEYWGDGEWSWCGLAYDYESADGEYAYHEVNVCGYLGKGLEISIG
jgi:hypothetical protein